MSNIHHWKFDEGSGSLADDAIGARDLTLAVAGTYATGRLTAFALSGTAHNTGFPVQAFPLTLMGWVRTKSNTNNVPLFGWWADQTTVTTNFALWAQRTDGFGPQNVLQGNIRLNGTLVSVGGGALTLGEWTHVALTYDGTTAILYTNGIEVGRTTASGSLPGSSTFSAYGASADIDDLRMFNTALTPAQVNAWMNTADQPSDPDPDPTPPPVPVGEHDLNTWVLTAGSETLYFGTKDSNYPFEVQASISDIDRDTQDTPHPGSDGVMMGRDLLRGFTLEFRAKILQEDLLTAKPWRHALDLYSAFAAKWRADRVRLTPGEYATLANLDRERMVYGRPRAIARESRILRKGILPFQMDFDTISPDFYSTTEKATVITRGASANSGFTGPLSAPISTVVGEAEVGPASNAGDLPAWPVIKINGPGRKHALELFDGSDLLWSVEVPGSLKYDEVMTIDTRPWRRSATINGAPANGLVRGSQFDECQIPVGSFTLRYRSRDSTGTSFAVINWRDTYASL